MAVFSDDWEIDRNEADWLARKRYNERSPFTILQYSSAGRPLAIDGEVAAQSKDILHDAGVTCRLCVAGDRTTWDGGQKPPPITGLQELEDFTWNFWCNRNVAVQLRTQGVLLYCKQGANRSAAAAIAVIAYITAAPWEQCAEMDRRARAIVDISRMAPRFTTIVNSFPARVLEDAVLLTRITDKKVSG